MSFESSRRAIYGQFAALWDMVIYPVVAENQPWPSGQQPVTNAWGRYSIRPATNLSIDIGATSKRVTGLVWLQIFIKESGGTSAATKMADAMEAIFAETRLLTPDSLLRFDRAELGYVGKDASGWEQYRCTVQYMEDAVTSASSLTAESGAITMSSIIDLPDVTGRTGGGAANLDGQSVTYFQIGQTVSFTRDGALEFYRLFTGAATAAHHVATPDPARHWEMTGGVI